jgi:AcrR family transcriptional regulator
MADPATRPSARQAELLDAAYAYVQHHGIGSLSLRPLATAIGSSPRVLLFLFGSKEGLVRALLGRARSDELDLLERLGREHPHADLAEAVSLLWAWLSDPHRAGVLRLWVEGYGRSLVEPNGPWGQFAERTVAEWLEVLSAYQPASRRRSARARAECTAALALLRGALLDLLATGDRRRVTAALRRQLDALRSTGTP